MGSVIWSRPVRSASRQSKEKGGALLRGAKERHVVVAAGVIVIFLSVVAVAFAYTHTTNGVGHGLGSQLWGHTWYPYGITNPAGSNYSTAEVRHYFDDGTFHVQCADDGAGYAYCEGDWGSAPCQKRYVGGADGLLARHWVRRDANCPGQIHS